MKEDEMNNKRSSYRRKDQRRKENILSNPDRRSGKDRRLGIERRF